MLDKGCLTIFWQVQSKGERWRDLDDWRGLIQISISDSWLICLHRINQYNIHSIRNAHKYPKLRFLCWAVAEDKPAFSCAILIEIKESTGADRHTGRLENLKV